MNWYNHLFDSDLVLAPMIAVAAITLVLTVLLSLRPRREQEEDVWW